MDCKHPSLYMQIKIQFVKFALDHVTFSLIQLTHSLSPLQQHFNLLLNFFSLFFFLVFSLFKPFERVKNFNNCRKFLCCSVTCFCDKNQVKQQQQKQQKLQGPVTKLFTMRRELMHFKYFITDGHPCTRQFIYAQELHRMVINFNLDNEIMTAEWINLRAWISDKRSREQEKSNCEWMNKKKIEVKNIEVRSHVMLLRE